MIFRLDLFAGAAFAYNGDPEDKIPGDESNYALVGLVLCAVFFVGNRAPGYSFKKQWNK